MGGICSFCIRGKHDHCPTVLGRGDDGPIFCICYCTGDTSFGNILYKEPVSKADQNEITR